MDCEWNDVEGLDSEPELRLVVHEALPEQEDAVEAINWDTLQILNWQDEEGRLEITDDDQMYALLGLRAQDENAEKARFLGQGDKESNQVNVENDTIGAAIPVSDEIPEERVVVHDPDKPCMDLGTVYPDMVTFRLAMIQYAINEEFELDIVRTDTVRYIANCKVEGCPWHIVGRRQPDGRTVMVTVLVGEHNCSTSARRKTKTPTCAWVASKAVQVLKKKPMGAKELRDFLQDKYNCEIHYDMAWKGREKAMKELYGCWEQSFQMLYNWRAEVLKRSPGSVIEIDVKVVDGKVYFHRFFCALRPCIDGFKEGCRPYLSIDSSALNGRWNGHIASASAIDGHNWMYPIAFGFIDGETEDNWTWFMRQLKIALGEMPVLAVCTDACKGLENSVATVFPQAEQRECFRHLMQNFIKRYSGEAFLKMYPAARTYRKRVFEYFFNQVLEASDDVKVWLERHHKLKWMRCEFNPDIKCDYITNNLAECLNNWIRDIKDLPVHELADKLYEMIMVLWEKRRRIGSRFFGKILPAVIQQLKAKTRGLGHLTVVKADSVSAHVWDSSSTHNRHVVKSHLHECTCLEWQHTGKPCQHALALITSQQNRDVKLEDFVHDYYSVDRFQKAYSRLIEPLPDKSQWPDVELPSVVGAPLDKRSAGRQRKLRIKGFLEGGNGKSKKEAKEAANEADKAAEKEVAEAEKGKKKMIRGKRKCKKCGELGHGETSYKCRLNGTKKRTRKPRKNTTKYGENAKVPTKRAKKQVVQESEQVAPPPGPTRETILLESPTRVTRSRLAQLMGETSSSHNLEEVKSPIPQKVAPKKLTPKKLKIT